MMKRLLLASTVLIAAPTFAEPWTVGQQTIAYTASHPLQAHDAASAYALESADIADNFTTATWIHGSSTCPSGGCGGFLAPGSGSEAKARFDCNDAFEANDDPIIAPGIQNGASHKHRFFGNLGAAAAPYNATYASLRASGNSTCYGGPINRSLYWEPEMFKQLSNGAVVGIIPKNVVTYYEEGALADIGTGKLSDPLVGSRWPRGISMIFGFNMSDPTDTRLTNIIAAANVGNPGRYSSIAATSAGGFVQWQCLSVLSGPTSAAYLSADGGVTSPLNCTPGTDLIAEILSYPCWDGVNLHSPDGRQHFMPSIRDNTLSKDVCPDNWVRVPQFRAKVTFNQTGVADYKTWYASSDRMDANSANWFKNGQSFHADFIPAWSYGTAAAPGPMVNFFVHCDGLSITISGTTLTGDAHECAYGRIDSTENLYVNEASPDASSPNPIVNLSPDQRGFKRYAPGQTGNSIPGTIHNNTSGMNLPANDTQLAGAAAIGFDLRKAGR